jgi:ceramide glucosyltransferase
MEFLLTFLQTIFLIPVLGGSIYWILCLLAVARLRTRPDSPPRSTDQELPPVTLLKPVCGVEKHQRANLRSACLQDYPEFQVVFSVQDSGDPALPLLKEMEREFGPERVSVVIKDHRVGPNGKVNNLLGSLSDARYDVLVISDSDVRLKPDYLRAIVSPFADPEVGGVCTLYRAICADRWFERLELLTFNADFIPSVIFAHVTGASKFCLGSSLALRRSVLKTMGGLEVLADYLVEDYEIGRRIWMSGRKIAVLNYFVDVVVDLKRPLEWWNHQVCWDQKTRSARPWGFLATLMIRSVPFAFFFAACRMGDGAGLAMLTGAVGVRLVTAAAIMGWGLRDRKGLRSLALLPVRDIVALGTWFLAFTKRTVLWRGQTFTLTREGRIVRAPGEPGPQGPS